jgi:DNA-directed RNA polymerase specialized sigma24 family protein
MYDAMASSSARVAEQLEILSVRENLMRIAFWSTKERAAAQDLVHDGLVRVLDPDDMPWDPAKGTFLSHMTYVLRHIWADRMRRRSAQEVVDDTFARDETIPSPGPEPDEALDAKRSRGIVEKLVEQLRTFLGESRPLAGHCLDLMGLGCETPREQAEQLACPVEEVYDAHEYMRRQAERIRKEWVASEKERMGQLRREGALARGSRS